MTHIVDLKLEAISLRKKGFSLNEISKKLHLAKSTTSIWLSKIELSPKAQKRLAQKQILGQYKSVLVKRKKRELEKEVLGDIAYQMISNIDQSKDLYKLYCALLWWCEGNKNSSFVRFTSSDSSLIQNFLFTFRLGFALDETKLRVLMHLHSYHDEDTQKDFWSKVTKIPKTQFHKSFQKENTGKRWNENYPGCIAVTYYDAQIAKELEAIYNAFTTHRGVR